MCRFGATCYIQADPGFSPRGLNWGAGLSSRASLRQYLGHVLLRRIALVGILAWGERR